MILHLSPLASTSLPSSAGGLRLFQSTARFGLTYAQNKYNAIIQAATDANQFGYIIDSNIKRIRLYISFIRKYDEEINSILESLHELVDANEDADFVGLSRDE